MNSFSFLLTSKWLILLITWAFALVLSFALRFWGIQHPEPFEISPVLIFALLFAPCLVMGAWLIYFGFNDTDS